MSRLHRAAAPPSAVDTTNGPNATEQRADDARAVGLLAVGAIIKLIGRPGVGQAMVAKSTQQSRNLLLVERTFQSLVATPEDRWPAEEGCWQRRWLNANKHRAATLLTQCSVLVPPLSRRRS